VKGKKMEREMKRMIRKVEKELGGMVEKRRGWDKECNAKKREERRELREWRKQERERMEYKKKRKRKKRKKKKGFM